MPSVGVLPYYYTTLHCMHYAQLFVQPHGLTTLKWKSMVNCFFSLTAYITSIRVDAQLFLQPHRLPHKYHSRCSDNSSASPLMSQVSQSMLSYFFSLTAYLPSTTVDAQLFLQPHRLPHKYHSRWSAISSASPLILQLTFSITSKTTGIYYWLLSITID